MEKQENQTFDIANLNPSQVTELKGWETKQNELVKGHPFVEVVDAESYDQAKKNRTALRTGRTDIQKQDKTIARVIKDFRTKTMEYAQKLVSITEPHEKKQQESIDKWEAVLEEKRQAKAKAEQERVEKIKKMIETCEGSLEKITQAIRFESINASFAAFNDLKSEYNANIVICEEFDFLMLEAIDRQERKFNDKVDQIKEAEKNRVERLKASQLSKYNEIKMNALELFKSTKLETWETAKEKIGKLNRTDLDLGEYNDSLSTFISELLVDLEALKIKLTKEQQGHLKAETINQRSQLIDWREIKIQEIRSLNAETFDKYSLKSTNLPEFKTDLVQEEVEKAIKIISDEYAMKSNALQNQIEELKAAKKKDAEIMEAQKKKDHQFQVRKNTIITKLGLQFDFKENAYIGKGVYIPVLEIQTKSDDEFYTLIESCQEIQKKEIEVKDAEEVIPETPKQIDGLYGVGIAMMERLQSECGASFENEQEALSVIVETFEKVQKSN